MSISTVTAWIRTISDEATSDSELSSMLQRAARGDTNLILMGVASAAPLILARLHTIVSVSPTSPRLREKRKAWTTPILDLCPRNVQLRN